MPVANRFLDLLKSRRTDPVVVAHRGDSFHAPENTLNAAQRGWEAGANAWELDVQLTRDGVAVVFHDETLARTTDVADRFRGDVRGQDGFRLSDFDWREVRTLDAGSWFFDERGPERSAAAFGTLEYLRRDPRALRQTDPVRVPTLVDALALTAELDWLVNVEIKSFPESPPGLTKAVLEAIARTGTSSRVLLSSYDHRELARIPSLLSAGDQQLLSIPRGVLTSTPLFRPDEYVTGIVGAQTYHTSASSLGAESIAYRRRPCAEMLQSEGLAELRAAGVPILVYTVNDHLPGGLGEHLAKLGVDGLFTDDPGGMKARPG